MNFYIRESRKNFCFNFNFLLYFHVFTPFKHLFAINKKLFYNSDKEILVFDLEKDCSLVRSFGYKILSRPYGLAFDSNYNLVVVDADLKSPLIYRFDRIKGAVLSAKPYKPVLPNSAGSNELVAAFSGKMLDDSKPIIASQVQPFQKTKIRFIGSNQNFLYAADLGRSLVFKTDLDGNIELAFGHYGKQRGEVNEPSGIHVDSDGYAIMVGDSKNNRIQVN